VDRDEAIQETLRRYHARRQVWEIVRRTRLELLRQAEDLLDRIIQSPLSPSRASFTSPPRNRTDQDIPNSSVMRRSPAVGVRW
jgi:hypothetical protein